MFESLEEAYHKGTHRQQTKDGYMVECKFGLWRVDAPNQEQAEMKGRICFGQYFKLNLLWMHDFSGGEHEELKLKKEKKIMGIKFCRDCKHCKPTFRTWQEDYKYARCFLFYQNNTDYLVQGAREYKYCSNLRGDEECCGESGKRWEKKSFWRKFVPHYRGENA